jgi:hypothetical protein
MIGRIGMNAKTAKKVRQEQQKIVGGQMVAIFEAINKQGFLLRLRAAKDILLGDFGFSSMRGFKS